MYRRSCASSTSAPVARRPPRRHDAGSSATCSAGFVRPGETGTTAARPEALLERSRHLAMIERALEEVQASGHGRAVLLGGEAGVGKTVLLRRFCDDREQPARILWGACDSLFTPRPLGPLVDIAQAAGNDLEDLVRAGRPHEVAGALIRNLAGSAPTVLVLDDLQWA